MSSTPIQAPPLASLGIDVPPSLRDSSSSAVSEIASSCLMAPTTLTPLSLSGRIAAVPPPFPLGLSALGMTDQSPHAPHSVGERQAPLPLELPGLDPMPGQPAQNLPAAAAPSPHAPHSFSERQAPLPLELPGLGPMPAQNLPAAAAPNPHASGLASQPLKATPPRSKSYLKDHPAWEAVNKQAYTPPMLAEIGRLTTGSERCVLWKCQKVGCEKVWVGSVCGRCRARISTLCASCTKISRPPLKTHEAWKAVHKPAYTPEQLEEIGNLTLCSHRNIFWKCQKVGCEEVWKSPIRSRCIARRPTVCVRCTSSKMDILSSHLAWRAVNKEAYEPEQLEEIGNLTQGSDTSVSWKCTNTACENEWLESVDSRCSAKYPTVCMGCTGLSKPGLQEHEAWEAVDTSEYTKEELKVIGKLTIGSRKIISWKCTNKGCGTKWESTVVARTKRKYPSMCNSCAHNKKGAKREQENLEDKGSRTGTKRSRTTKE